MSILRAKCPVCRTYTAVAIGPGYECHSCGREFGAGLVRVPRAWGHGGDAMAAAAALALPYPEVAVIDEPTLGEQELALATALPERPVVLGGCCCAHVGAIKGLSARFDRLALVWIDAHGDLNTPESSPSGDQWGMPLRMTLDAGSVRLEDTVLVGVRDLDPPEEAFIRASRVSTGASGIGGALAGADAVYVAIDCDVLDAADVVPFMPVPGGITLADAEALLRAIAGRTAVAGVGFSGLLPEAANVVPLSRLVSALGL